MSVPYLIIPMIALFCYAVLFLAILSVKKNRVIITFMFVLVLFLFWTLGSVFMRLQLYPNYQFWYYVSLLALFCLPLALYHFIEAFLSLYHRLQHYIFESLTILLCILTLTNYILPVPEIETNAAGQFLFIYQPNYIRLLFPTLLTLAISFQIFKMIYQVHRKHDLEVLALRPFYLCGCILIIGNILSVLPGNVFPFDTLAGIFFAVFAFYTLSRNRIFHFTLLVSHQVLIFVCLVLVTLVALPTLNPLSALIRTYFPLIAPWTTAVLCVLFTLTLFLIYSVVEHLTNQLFLKKEQTTKQRLKEYGLAISKVLNTQVILELTEAVITDSIPSAHLNILLLNEKEHKYKTVHSSKSLDTHALSFEIDTPFIHWFKTHDGCLCVADIKRSAFYSAMWESEKNMLAEEQVRVMVGLKHKDKLFGLMVLCEGPDRLDFDTLNFLESVEAFATISLNNAALYERSQLEAQTDSLTGLFNRKTILRKIESVIKNSSTHSLALALISLDDFRLFNELYGSQKGDTALSSFAKRIHYTLGSKGFAGRYGGKEFILCLPNHNQMQILQLVQNLQKQMAELHSLEETAPMKTLTFSAGICVYPYSASNAQEILTNANMSVFQAKTKGKNCIVTYHMQDNTEEYNGPELSKPKNDVYDKYASTVYALTAAIDAKDHYTFQHSQNVAAYAATLAKHMGLDSGHVNLIHEAGLLHDIGKIAIPENILTKPGKLTFEEYTLIKSHVIHSIGIIRYLPNLDYLIPTVTSHHERWDGKGYPRGLTGKEIPLGGRYLAIADAFDAMTSDRCYRDALDLESVLSEILKGSGHQFDPSLTGPFVNLVHQGTIYLNMPFSE